MRCPKCQSDGAVLVRAGALRCATCGVVDPDGQPTTEAAPDVIFAPPPLDDMRPLPPDVQRKPGAWRVPLAMIATLGVFIGTRLALERQSEIWAGVAVVSTLLTIALSWDQVRRTFGS